VGLADRSCLARTLRRPGVVRERGYHRGRRCARRVRR